MSGTWTVYMWPDLRFLLPDEVNRIQRKLTGTPRCLPMKTNPEEVISMVLGTDLTTYTLDGGPFTSGWDGTICPVDAGQLNSGMDGGPIDLLDPAPPSPVFMRALGVFKVVSPVAAGQIDIEMVVNSAEAVDIPRYRNVCYDGSAPSVGDVGTAWLLPSEEVFFFRKLAVFTPCDAQGTLVVAGASLDVTEVKAERQWSAADTSAETKRAIFHLAHAATGPCWLAVNPWWGYFSDTGPNVTPGAVASLITSNFDLVGDSFASLWGMTSSIPTVLMRPTGASAAVYPGWMGWIPTGYTVYGVSIAIEHFDLLSWASTRTVRLSKTGGDGTVRTVRIEE